MLKRECKKGQKVRMKENDLLYEKGDIFTIQEVNPLKYPELVDLGGFYCSPMNFEKVIKHKFKENEVAYRENIGECIIIKYLDRSPEDIYLIFLKLEERYQTVYESQLRKIKKKGRFYKGDKAFWLDNRVKIWGKHYEEDSKKYEYAIKFIKGGQSNRTIVYEEELKTVEEKTKENLKQFRGV